METPGEDKSQTNTSQNNSQFTFQIQLPNSTAVLVLGILSIVGCWCFGVIGLTLGIIALALAKTSYLLYIQDPNKYTISSYNNMNAGKICAIIGTSLSGLYIVLFVVKIIFFGATLAALLSGLPWHH
jgi:hypothetical protein